MKNFTKIFFCISFLIYSSSFAQNLTEKVSAINQVTINFQELATKAAAEPEIINIPDLSNKKTKTIPLPREVPAGQPVIEYKGPDYVPQPIGNAINVVSPAPTLNFTGFLDNIQSIPPDVHGAVGPNHVVTTLNPRVVIHDKTTGAVISSISLDAFWSALNGGGFTVATFDPKIYYDPFSSRWIFVVCSNGGTANSSLLVAVSANTDPTGTWNLYRYDVDATNTNWFDYPSCGYNKNWFVVTGNMFPNVGSTYAGAKIYVFDKTDLYNAGSLTATTFSDANGFTMVPAETFDNTLNTLYMIEEFSGTGTWRMTQITGTATSPTYSVIGNVSIGANTYSYTSGAANNSSLPQSGSANRISSNDARIQNVVYRNGFLWASQTIFKGTTVPKPAAAQWLKFNTSPSISLNQFGRVDDASNVVQFAFPSISVNKDNDALIGYSRFSAGQFASAAYSFRKSTDAAGTMQDPYQYKNGEASYFKTYGGTRNRWGDYSVVAIDPSNDTDFWTQQEYASTSTVISGTTYDRWSTQWAKVVTCVIPAQPGAFSASTSTVCQGQNSVVYTVPTVAGATSYTWTYSGTGASFSSTSNSVSINYSAVSTSGTLSVSANNACGSGTARTLSITVNGLPAQPGAFSASTSTVCQGQNSVVYTVPTVVGATSYTWTYSGTGASFSSTSNSVSINYSAVSTSGTLSVSANSACGSGTARTLSITVNTAPVIPTISTNKTIICSGLGAILTATGCTGTVTWSNGATGNSITVTPTVNTTYNAVCSNTSCPPSNVSSNILITVIPQNLVVDSSTPAPYQAKDNITTSGTIIINGSKTYKAGKSISLTSTPTTSISTGVGAVFEAKIEGCSY